MKMAAGYLLVATAVIIFLAFPPLPPPQKSGIRRTLHPRHGNDHAPFDPLVTKLLQGATTVIMDTYSLLIDPESSSTPFTDVFEVPEEYFSDVGEFDVEARLQILFPILDRSPQDGKISLEELEAWNLQQATNQLIARTDKEMKYHDKDEDGTISFAEYLPVFSAEELEKNDMEHGQAGWWREKFDTADEDGNGLLSFKEFMDFLYPEDSTNEKLQLWSLKELMRTMDVDNDGKLNFVEFKKQAYYTYKYNFEFEIGRDDVPSAVKKFSQLDANRDRFLTAEELMPIIGYLQPGELTYAKHYTKHLIHQADDDKDGQLTLNEMLNHHEKFYSTVVIDEEVDNHEDHFHEEF